MCSLIANLLMIAVMLVLVYTSYKSILKDRATGEYKTMVIATMASLGLFAGSFLLLIFNRRLDESFKWFFVSFVIILIVWNAVLYGLGFDATASSSTSPFTMAIGAASNYTAASRHSFAGNNTAYAYSLFKPSFPSNYTIMDSFCNDGIVYVTLSAHTSVKRRDEH